MKPATQHTADQLSLMPATVSGALNNRIHISADTRQLVNKIAQHLHSPTNRIASLRRTGRSHSTAVIIPSAWTNFFGSGVHGTMVNIYMDDG